MGSAGSRRRQSRQGLRTTLWLAALCLLSSIASPAAAAPAPDALPELSGVFEIAGDLGHISGTLSVRLLNPTSEPLQALPLWLFPERLGTPPAAMDEIDLPRSFPRGFDPGGMTLGAVVDGAGRLLSVERTAPTLALVHLAQPVAPGDEVRVDVQFTTRVPHRYGPFGHAEGQLTLDGGFVPRPPPLDAAGFHPDAPPDDAVWSVSAWWRGDAEVMAVVGGRATTLAPGARLVVERVRAERLTLVVLTRWQRSHLKSQPTTIELVHRRPRHFDASPGHILDLSTRDVHAQTMATAAAGLKWLGGLCSRPLPTELLIVEAPLRRTLVIGAPGVVLVSDWAFELFPGERLRKIHRLALLRAVFATVLGPRLRPAEPRDRRNRVLDAVATDLVERWEKARYEVAEGSEDAVSAGEGVAAIDDGLEAAQLPFKAAYFRIADDTDPYRDHVTLFSHRLPGGGFWRQKVRDRAGYEAMDAVSEAVLGGLGFEEALRRHGEGATMEWLAQWDGGMPEVAYRLGRVTPFVGDDGARAVEVEIIREGAVGLVEPVMVRVDEQFIGRWDGQGERGVLRLPARRRRPHVELDPLSHLMESDLGRPVDPRWDNRNFHPWRALLEGFSLTVNSVSKRVDINASGFLKRDDDINHLIALEMSDESRRLQAGATWLRSFGPKVRPNRRRGALGLGMSLAWLKPDGGAEPGVGVKLSVSLRDLTYIGRTDPRDGWMRELSLGPAFNVRGGQVNAAFFARGVATRLVSAGHAHVFGFRGDLATWVGDVPEGERWPVGGLENVRAFGSFDGDGRHRVLATAEWRHRLGSGLSMNLAHLSWVERVDGVFFIDGALLGDAFEELFEAEGVYVGIGYGLRFHYLLAGVHPFLLSFDFGFPVVRDGQVRAPGNKVSFVFGVEQAF